MLASISFVAMFVCACASYERVPYDAPGYVDGKAIHPTIKIGKGYRVNGRKYYPEYDPDYEETGMASWYGPNFHGKKTANGERYNQYAMTAAHRTLPLPSVVKVTRQETGKSIIVRVNDRGPFHDNRIIDLSRAAAEELDMIGAGVAKVRVEYIPELTERYIAKLGLEKPDEWKATDYALRQQRHYQPAIAKAQHVEEVMPRYSYEVASTEAIAVSDPVPLMNDMPVMAAANTETTLNERGIVMEEIGYAEAPFSVLDQEVFDTPASELAYDMPDNTKVQSYSYVARDMASLEPAAVTLLKSAPEPIYSHTKSPLFVQVASYRELGNAERMAKKLSSLSAVDIQEVSVKGSNWHRVRLGPIHNQAVADELLVRVEEYGVRDARIVRE